MKSLIWLVVMLICPGCGEARACGPNWTYIGCPPWEVICMLEDPADSARMLAGTFRVWDIPESGGIWEGSRDDTTWAFRGLRGLRIFMLRTYPYCRSRPFASTDNGLYRFVADTTWLRVTGVGTPVYVHQDFAISPFDTSLWAVATWNLGAGNIYLSTNSGQSWAVYYVGYVTGHIEFSRISPGLLYFTEQEHLYRTHIADTTTQAVMYFPDGIQSAAWHEAEPWLYVLGRTSVGRYSESNGDTMRVLIPVSVQYATSMVYAPGAGLVVASSDGLFRVSDDLAEWHLLGDSTLSRDWRIYLATSSECVAGAVGSLFSDATGSFTPLTERQRAPAELLAYPNPAPGTIHVIVPYSGRLQIFDVLGRTVETVEMSRGDRSRNLTFSSLSNGIYFYQLTPSGVGAVALVGKFVVIH